MKDPVFNANPKLEQYFKTADGNAFFTEHDAKNHATSLKSKKVEKVERPFVKEKAKTTPPVNGEGKEPINNDDTNVDNASYEELMLFVKDNEIELESKKTEDVREAIRAYLADPNKKIVPFRGDLN